MKPPELPEKRVVFVVGPACLLKVWVVASKHVQVGAVCNTAMSTAGGRHTVSWGTGKTKEMMQLARLKKIIWHKSPSVTVRRVLSAPSLRNLLGIRRLGQEGEKMRRAWSHRARFLEPVSQSPYNKMWEMEKQTKKGQLDVG